MIYVTDYVDNPDLERSSINIEVASFLDYVDFTSVTGLLVWHQSIDGEYLDKFPNLKFVQRYGVGFDCIDLAELERRNIAFANNPDYGVEEVASSALAMILNLCRGISHYHDVSRRLIEQPDGTWQENTLRGLRRLSEVKLSILGFGRIGQRLAQIATPSFNGIRVYDPYLRSGTEKIFGAEKVEDLEVFLNDAQVLSLHCPLNSSTRGMVDEWFLNQLHERAILINTARGELIDDLQAVVDAVLDGSLAGAGLDVLPSEPPVSVLNSDLFDQTHGRLLINPHTAYFSHESYIEMRTKAARNCARFLTTGKADNVLIS